MNDITREKAEIGSIGVDRWNDIERIGGSTKHSEVAAYAAKRLIDMKAWGGVEYIAKCWARKPPSSPKIEI